MICYRDRSYCSDAEKCVSAEGCHRNLTDDEAKRADKMGLPIAWTSFRLSCKDFVEPSDE